MEQRTVTIKNFSRITKIVQVSAMKVHFQIAERSLFYINPDIHLRRIAYPSERGQASGTGTPFGQSQSPSGKSQSSGV